MSEHKVDIRKLEEELEELKAQLDEANCIIEAIREGAVDALVVQKDGEHNVYSLESADYTYRILIEKFGEGALSISESGLILYCNEAFSRLMGKPGHKIVGTFFNSYVDSVGSFQELKNALATGPSKGEIVLNIAGRKLPVYVSLSDLQPQVPAIGIIVTDLTEQRKHEDAIALYHKKLELKVNELNVANRKLEQFIHVISHDIKEPIRKIVTYSTHLNHSNTSLNVASVNDLNVITTSALRLNSLVEDLVKYSFSTADKEFRETDLNTIIKEVSEDLELLITEKKVSLHAGKLPAIIGSGVQVRQLFTNLIANAIKYSKKDLKPRITILAEKVDCIDNNYPNREFHKIIVSDNGIGMSKDQIGRIFTIFQRLHMPHEYSGNGIGLAICKRIMENHNGKIEVESSPNEGSSFHIYFPVQQEKDSGSTLIFKPMT
ncbi:MAG: sensor signal transduction histidine kinase, phytochrome A-like protein [Bacteroidetes bacterium]|jgi:signal transduction histidine kinase|nr:sensor signal transduction histidine kinase, phytochrome A-like protein [Bacteroidota bacterium]